MFELMVDWRGTNEGELWTTVSCWSGPCWSGPYCSCGPSVMFFFEPLQREVRKRDLHTSSAHMQTEPKIEPLTAFFFKFPKNKLMEKPSQFLKNRPRFSDGQLRDVLYVVLHTNNVFFNVLIIRTSSSAGSFLAAQRWNIPTVRTSTTSMYLSNLKYSWCLVFHVDCVRLWKLWAVVCIPQVQHRALRLNDGWNETRTNCVSVLHHRPSCSPAVCPGSVG